MKRKKVFLFSIIFCLCLFAGCKGKSQNQGIEAIPNDTIAKPDIQQASINDVKSYFPDITLGIQDNKNKKLIPTNIATVFFPYHETSDEAANSKLYAVAKIIGYKGLDLFICNYEYERPDEESYDRHIDGQQYLLLFKDNKALIKKEEDGIPKQLIHVLNCHYYGEGGESEYKSYFDKDTTIVTYQHSSASESATGFETPIASTKEFRSKLNRKGDLKIIEVTRIEFSSPFFDKRYLKENENPWKKSEEYGGRKAYPTKDEKWELAMDGIFYQEAPKLFDFPLDLYFYIETINGEMKTVFESYKNEQLIDHYVLGQDNSDIPIEKNYFGRTKILKCPIIIKTSYGNLELLPNGKFVPDNKNNGK